MSLELIVARSKSIESALVKRGASGKGLHEKVSSIERQLSSDLVKKVRFIASVRNKCLHDDDYFVSNDTMDGFLRACDQVDYQLSRMLVKTTTRTSSSSKSSSPSKGLVEQFNDASALGKIGIVAGAAATLAAFVFFSNK